MNIYSAKLYQLFSHAVYILLYVKNQINILSKLKIINFIPNSHSHENIVYPNQYKIQIYKMKRINLIRTKNLIRLEIS